MLQGGGRGRPSAAAELYPRVAIWAVAAVCLQPDAEPPHQHRQRAGLRPDDRHSAVRLGPPRAAGRRPAGGLARRAAGLPPGRARRRGRGRSARWPPTPTPAGAHAQALQQACVRPAARRPRHARCAGRWAWPAPTTAWPAPAALQAQRTADRAGCADAGLRGAVQGAGRRAAARGGRGAGHCGRAEQADDRAGPQDPGPRVAPLRARPSSPSAFPACCWRCRRRWCWASSAAPRSM